MLHLLVAIYLRRLASYPFQNPSENLVVAQDTCAWTLAPSKAVFLVPFEVASSLLSNWSDGFNVYLTNCKDNSRMARKEDR